MKKKMFFGFYDLNGVPRKVLKLVIKSDKQGALEELMIFPHLTPLGAIIHCIRHF